MVHKWLVVGVAHKKRVSGNTHGQAMTTRTEK